MKKLLIVLAALAIALLAYAYSTVQTALPENLERASVAYVVDGDTICVQRDGASEEERVRLIGVDAPESVAHQDYLDATGKENTQEGVDASDYLKELLPQGTTVWLEKDESDTDRYERLLRYVWLEEPETISTEEVQAAMVNAMLVSSGHATPKEYEPDTKYAQIFEEIYESLDS